jgi:vacuolar protein sorting-associated protein 13A/C
MRLLQSVARVVSSSEVSAASPSPNSNTAIQKTQALPSSSTDLQPEIDKTGQTTARKNIWSTLDAVVTLEAVKLHLYDRFATTEETLKDHGIARFALNSSTLRAKTLSDGAMEAELVLKSFTMSNTRPGNSKFREIIPAAQHTRNQVMILYTASGGTDGSSIAVITVDSPQVIFAVEPVIGLLEFFSSAFGQETTTTAEVEEEETGTKNTSSTSSTMNVRLDLHDLNVSILEDDANVDSRAIRLSIKTISLSHQACILNFQQSND